MAEGALGHDEASADLGMTPGELAEAVNAGQVRELPLGSWGATLIHHNAQFLRSNGLPWSRSQLADLEMGRRQDVTLAEVILLAETFRVPLATLMEGKGLVQLGNTERQLPTVRGIVGGEAPQDADLLGPSHIPGLSPEIHGKGPHWVRMEDGVSYVFSSTEVEGPRRLGVPVAQVHDMAREIWDGPTLDGELERKLSGTKGQDPEAVTRDLVSQLRTRLRSRSS